MFNLQGSELIIILLLALVVLGPEKLPDAMRKLGQFYAEIRKMSSGFQQEFRSVMDEPVQEMRDTANLLRDSADFTKLQDGERDEKPKSAEMSADGDPEPELVDDVPFATAAAAREGRDDVDGDPSGERGTERDDEADGLDDPGDVAPTTSGRPQPFSGNQLSSAAPRPESAKPSTPTDVVADATAAADTEGDVVADATAAADTEGDVVVDATAAADTEGDVVVDDEPPSFGRNPMTVVPPPAVESRDATDARVVDEVVDDEADSVARAGAPGVPDDDSAAGAVETQGSDAPGDPTR